MVTDQSSVKSTAKIPIFNEFLNTFLEIQILRYFIGNSNYIHTICKNIFIKFQAIFFNISIG